MSITTPLRIAICLFPQVTALDYAGPIEVFSFLHPELIQQIGSQYPEYPRYSIEATFLSYTLDPIKPKGLGPSSLPDATYDQEHDQFDILLVPGGPGARPHNIQPSITAFIKAQAPKAKYILSVCTGAWILANAGLLDGKNATTNKAAFTSCKEATSKEINWIPKARWVVDGNIWTSSGVTAGTDMAHAFVEHLVGAKIARFIQGRLELHVGKENEDEYAEFYGLV